MRKAAIYFKEQLAGFLTEENQDSYLFEYTQEWLADSQTPPISLTLPKQAMPYRATVLFPFFCGMTSEGANRKLQSKFLRIDERDALGFLLATAQSDTIGAVTVKPIKA